MQKEAKIVYQERTLSALCFVLFSHVLSNNERGKQEETREKLSSNTEQEI
jgi:hypothetical protein